MIARCGGSAGRRRRRVGRLLTLCRTGADGIGLLVLVVLCWLVTACGSPDRNAPPEAGATVPVRAPSPGVSPLVRNGAPTRTAEASSPVSPDGLVALATADAADRTGLARADVRAVRVEARVWSDRSLGCPRPGMGYAQAITPGYLIVLEAAGRELEYHTDHAQIVLCNG